MFDIHGRYCGGRLLMGVFAYTLLNMLRQSISLPRM